MAHLAPAGRSSETRCEGGAKDVDGQLGEKAYKGITWAQLAQHSTRAKPWLAIDGIVYDCTDFVDLHPGGKVLLAYAGTDATQPFRAFHGPSARAVLKDLEVGPLLSEPDNLHPSSKSQPDAELENVREQLVAEGYFEASRLYYARKVLEIMLFWATAALLLFHGQAVLASVSMALMWQQGGWMSHDLAHNCFFRRNRKANARMLLLTGAITIGFSPEWWKGKHNYHHAVPNEVDNVGNPVDPDIDTLPVLAWDSSIASHSLSAFKPALRHQQFLLAPALAVARASWVTQSLLKAVHDARAKDGSINELLCLCGHHLSTFAFAAVLAPAPAAAITFYLAAQCIGGIVLGSAFVVSHNGKEVHTGKEGFVAEQVATTRNVNRGAFNNWFMGALNMQVEHHLFPTLPRHSLPRAAELVKQLCNRNGLLYEDVGLLEAFGLVHKHLKAVAKAI